MNSSHNSEDEGEEDMEAAGTEEVNSTESGASGSKSRKRRGPPKKHPVWEYFNDENGQSSCCLCSYKVKGAYSTTLMNHLISNHLKQHRLLLAKKAKEEKEKEKKVSDSFDFMIYFMRSIF